MTTRFFLSRQQVFDDAGNPSAGALLDFYATGTSTLKDTFSDAALTVPNTNPVVADAAGRFGDIFLEPGDYKARLRTAAGVTVWTADPVAGDTSVAPASGGARNLLINGDFRFSQRGFGGIADDTYCMDRWYVLTSTGNVTVSQLSLPEIGQPSALRMTQPDVTAKRMGHAQIVEASGAQPFRNAFVTLSGRVRCSLSQPIRYAILAWTGTANSVTSDVVNDWTSASYTPGGFFLASNLVVVAVGVITPSATTWTDLPAINGQAPNGLNNLVAMVWTEGTIAQNATLDMGLMQLESGQAATAFERRQNALELALCQRYYETGSTSLAFGAYTAGATCNFPIRLVPKLALPVVGQSGGSLVNVSSITVASNTVQDMHFVLTATATGACSVTSAWAATAEL